MPKNMKMDKMMMGKKMPPKKPTKKASKKGY